MMPRSVWAESVRIGLKVEKAAVSARFDSLPSAFPFDE